MDSVVDLDGNTLQRNVVYGHNTSALGGALYTNSSGDVINNRFIENFGDFRGGAFVCDVAAPLVKGNEFVGNQAQNDGAGAYLLGCTSIVEDNLFENNYTLDDGAALNCKGHFLDEDGNVVLTGGTINHMKVINNRFINNRSLGRWWCHQVFT